MRLIKFTALLTLSLTAFALASSSLDELKTKAESGDVEVQYELGMKYFYGKGIDIDYFQAEKWFHEAAEQGHIRSQFELGKLYDPEKESTYGFEKRYRRYRYGNKQKHNLQSNIYGDPRDTVVAYDSIRYKVDAEKWLLKAAHNGLPEAQTSLAWFYMRGQGKHGNSQDANDWLEKAAKQNYMYAQFMLLESYAAPLLYLEDLVRAYFWLTISIENNSEFVGLSPYKLDEIEKRMTKEQLQEAKLLLKKEKDQILNQSPK